MVILGAIIGGVRDPATLALFALFAVLYHFFGFLDNNLCDLQWDKKDPAKKHFPLVSGEISPKTAKIVDFFLIIVTLALGIFLAKTVTAFAFLILSLVSGMLYNRTCKLTLDAPVYIVLAFTSLPLFSYFTVAQELSFVMFLVAIFSSFAMAFQIGTEGYAKDIKTDPVNLLRSLGTTVKRGKLHLGKKSYLLSLGLKVSGLVVGIEIWRASGSGFISMFLVFLSALGISMVFVKLLDEKYDNVKITKNAALMEILTYFLLIFSLQGILGWETVGFFIGYPLIWFILMNKITWGTLLRPRV